MTRKIVAIHGIGQTKPGWSEPSRVLLGVPQEDWIEFYYEDLMNRSFFQRLTVAAAKFYLKRTYGPEALVLTEMAQEHLNDIISYFVMNGTRLEILVRLKGILKQYPDCIILSHSLGSVVAYEALKNFDVQAHSLFTFGSPLSKRIVRNFLRIPNSERPTLANWFNIWSFLDPISGKINQLGCRLKDQFRIRSSHALLSYIESQRHKILSLYQETALQPQEG